MLSAKELHERRKARTRYQLKRKNIDKRPRLSIFRSGRHISAQIIDDAKGHTLASASSLEADLRKKLKNGADKKAAAAVGKLLGERAKKAGATKVVFDRGGYYYTGRVAALAEAAREAGMEF